MEVTRFTVYRGTEILNRPDGWEGIPITLDFTAVTDTIGGVKIVKAGTPLSKAGVAANTAYAAGVLISDVFESRPIGTILKKAYINKARAQEHSGVTIDATVLAALPMIVLE